MIDCIFEYRVKLFNTTTTTTTTKFFISLIFLFDSFEQEVERLVYVKLNDNGAFRAKSRQDRKIRIQDVGVAKCGF